MGVFGGEYGWVYTIGGVFAMFGALGIIPVGLEKNPSRRAWRRTQGHRLIQPAAAVGC